MNEQKENHTAELLARATSLSRLLEDAQPGLSTCELYAKNMQFIHDFWDNGEKNALKARVAALEKVLSLLPMDVFLGREDIDAAEFIDHSGRFMLVMRQAKSLLSTPTEDTSDE